MIDCADVKEDVSLWMDGELDPSRAEAVEKHLESAPGAPLSIRI